MSASLPKITSHTHYDMYDGLSAIAKQMLINYVNVRRLKASIMIEWNNLENCFMGQVFFI